MKTFLLILFFSIGFSNLLIAQERTITGTVTDEDGKSMPFVTVAIKGTTKGAATDIDGKFTIEHVSPTDTLLFSFVGYESKKVVVGEQSTIHVKLGVNSTQLEEVVVTALGVNRQKRELGYATEKIDGNEIRESNSPNILNAITGKATGVEITNPDGVDGGTTRITIRGNNNIGTDNQPLIVVDGVPLSNDPGIDNKDVGRGTDWGSAINNINMQDVENINILKGGAASALYGARGANGVVLITMKKGKKQKGIGVSYNMSYKISHPYRYREVQNVYGGGAPDANVGTPVFIKDANGVLLFPVLGTDATYGYPGSAVSWGPKMEGQMVKWWDGTMRPWSPQPDNLKIPFRDGNTVSHNVSAEGGGDFGTMRISLTRLDNVPIIFNSNYNQTTINANSILKVSDKVSLGLSLSYIDYHRLNSPALGDDENSFSKGSLYSWPRSYQGEDLQNYQLNDGTRNPLVGFPYLYIDQYLWWNQYNHNTTLDRSKLIGALTLNYSITPWLNFMGTTNIDYTSDEYQTKNTPTDFVGLLNGYYSDNQIRDRGNNSRFSFTATKNNIFRSDFNLTFSLGGETWTRNVYSISAHSGKWYFPNWYSVSNYSPTDPLQDIASSENFYRKKINSSYSSIDLSYKNYLFIGLTGRNDWSSTLPANANSYFYPGFSVSYIASDALKFKSDRFNFCKLRGSVAQTATDANPYLTSSYYTTNLFGSAQVSILPDTIPSISLKPQRVNTFEFGTTLGFFNDRITVDFSYYYKYCFDQIIDLSIPFSGGSDKVSINDGVLTNKGFELALTGVVIQKKNFLLKTGLSFSRNRNKVVSLGNYNAPYVLASIWGDNGPQMSLYAGQDYGTILGWDYVYKNGQPIVNAEGTKDSITTTRVPIGNASPDFLAGWSTEIKYKNFTLHTLVDTKWGGDIYSGSYVTGLQTGQSPETLKERDGGGLPYTDAAGNTTNTGVILPGVHADGTPNTTVVSYIYKYMPNAGGWGDFVSKPGILEDTWVKLREVTLSYTVPQNFIKRMKIFQELTLSVTGRDLFYIYTTLPDHINPEGISGAGNAQGLEWASLPGVRSFSFSINARF